MMKTVVVQVGMGKTLPTKFQVRHVPHGFSFEGCKSVSSHFSYYQTSLTLTNLKPREPSWQNKGVRYYNCQWIPNIGENTSLYWRTKKCKLDKANYLFDLLEARSFPLTTFPMSYALKNSKRNSNHCWRKLLAWV